MLLTPGATVVDQTTREPAQIAHIQRVPRQHDLFGHPIRAHRRVTLRFADGRFAIRHEGELTPA